jgi:hypothetical protein
MFVYHQKVAFAKLHYKHLAYDVNLPTMWDG